MNSYLDFAKSTRKYIGMVTCLIGLASASDSVFALCTISCPGQVIFGPPWAPAFIFGHTLGCQGGFKPWIARDEHVKLLEGTLHKFKYYPGGILDRDVNFIIKPDPGFTYLAVRSDGTKNGIARDEGFDQEGLIEAEVMTVQSLVNGVFPDGVKVRVRGWWVEDIWHGYKTEIHPLRSIISQTGGETAVLVSHDWSDRFCVDEESLNESVVVPTNPIVDTKIVNTYTGGTEPVEAVLESAILDIGTGSKRSTISVSHTVNVEENKGSLNINLHFDPTNPDEYRPVYLARFNTDTSASFYDSVTLSMQPYGPNCQALQIDLKGGIALPSPSNLPSLTQWNWRIEPGEIAGSTSDIGSRLFYSPCANLNNTSWTFVETASTGGSNYLPPRGASGDTGRDDFVSRKPTRTFISKARIYNLEPSRVQISRTSTPPSDHMALPPTPTLLGASSWTCGGETELTAHTTLAPMQDEQKFQWVIPVPVPSPHGGVLVSNLVLNTANPQESVPGFTASLDTSDPHRMTISWDTVHHYVDGMQNELTSMPVSGSGSVPIPNSVQAQYNTQVGEQPTAQVSVSRPCGPRSVQRSVLEMIKDLHKLELALRKLGGRNFPTSPRGDIKPPPGDIDPLPPMIRQLTLDDAKRLPSERQLGNLSKRNRELMRTVLKAYAGEIPNRVEFQKLTSALAFASRIKWDSRVSVKNIETSLMIRGINIR